LIDVRFLEFKSAVQGRPVVLVKVEIKAINAWNTAIHALDHFVLKF